MEKKGKEREKGKVSLRYASLSLRSYIPLVGTIESVSPKANQRTQSCLLSRLNAREEDTNQWSEAKDRKQ